MENPMHLDEGQIQRFADTELTSASDAGARVHIGECADCRARVAAAEEENAWVVARLRELDHPAPDLDLDAIVRRRDGRMRGWGRWAASILVVVSVAGVAYAAPRSPLGGIFGRMSAWMLGDRREVTAPASPARDPVAAGTAVVPGDSLRIVFLAEQPDGVATVSITSASVAQVRAIDDIATFTVDPDRISIDNRGSRARFELDIPASARRVEVLVGDRRILLKDGARVITDAPLDPDGMYRIALFVSRR